MSRLFKKSVLILIFTFAGLSFFVSCSKESPQSDKIIKTNGVSNSKLSDDEQDKLRDELKDVPPLLLPKRVMPEDARQSPGK